MGECLDTYRRFYYHDLMPEVFLPRMTFAEVEAILDQVELAAIPTGSNEAHGPHLPLKVDAAIAEHVTVQAAQRLYPKVIVTPTLAVGHSPQHLDFAGSMTLRVETQINVLLDYCRSLMTYGIRRFAIVNAHGANMQPNALAARRITEDLGVKVINLFYTHAIDPETAKTLPSNMPGHADDFEGSLILHICPEDTHMDRTHEIEDKYGLAGQPKPAPPGHAFLATTTFNQKGLRQSHPCDVGSDSYKNICAENGKRYSDICAKAIARAFQVFIAHVPE